MKRKHLINDIPVITLGAALFGLAVTAAMPARAVDLLERYPTKLTGGDTQPERARSCQFSQNDLFQLTRFHFEVGKQLKIETGPASLGIGHCADGAVWAIVMPTAGGALTRQGSGSPEQIAHIWLRFHPGELNRLFPPDTVSSGCPNNVMTPMRTIAGAKMRASWQANGRAMIPEPKDMTVDVDTKSGPRRFFGVDMQAKKAGYESFFENKPVRVAAAGSAAGAHAPKIISSKPENGATDVDPGLTEITVTFDQDMEGGMSWTGGGPEYPRSPEGAKAEWRGKRTCVFPVKLESGHHYRVGINSPSFRNFRSAGGESAEPASISFTTK
jgi:hypothetical protein